MNRFVVIGLGHFGSSVAKRLHEEGKEVIAIDADPEKVQDAVEFSSQAICADATEMRTLQAIGLEDVDAAVVSLGKRMDIITLAALHVKELGIPYTIVKALSNDHEKILRAIGVNEVVHPEEFAARSLGIRLALFGASSYLPILPNYSVVLIKVPESYVDSTMSAIESRHVQVVAIQRGGEVILSPPDKEILQKNDMLVILGDNEHLNSLSGRIQR